MATRLAASSDLFADGHPKQHQYFATCHDGFTLLDLVSYNAKHNEANGDGNVRRRRSQPERQLRGRGPREDPAPWGPPPLRRAKNFMAALMVSQGVPNGAGGRLNGCAPRAGNNNAYCRTTKPAGSTGPTRRSGPGCGRFTAGTHRLAAAASGPARRRFLSGGGAGYTADIKWYDETGATPNWDDAASRILCFLLRGAGETEPDLYVALNMSAVAVELALPAGPPWQRLVDTALASPDDVLRPDAAEPVPETSYRLGGEAVAILQRPAD